MVFNNVCLCCVEHGSHSIAMCYLVMQVKFMGDGDHEIAPSRVLHVRHLPPDTTESEVSALGAPFGRVVTVMLLRTRNQAFLEMADEAYATAVVRFYNCVSANVR